MKKNLALIVLLVISVAVFAAGCDRIKQMLGIGAPQPAPGPAALTPGSQLYDPGAGPGGPGMVTPGMSPPRTLNCCTITNFKMGKIREDETGRIGVYEEASTIPYVPSAYFGISFEYRSNTGAPIVYTENEFFPAPPQDWTLWEGSEASYKTFPDENRAVYTITLAPRDTPTPFVSHWGFNPSGDPVGQWRWDIYFDKEYYTTVVFDVVPATP